VLDEPAARYDTVFRFVRRRTATDADAAEITQSVFAQAAAQLDSATQDSPAPLAWLYTVAQRRLADEARRRHRRGVPVPLREDTPGRNRPRVARSRPRCERHSPACRGRSAQSWCSGWLKADRSRRSPRGWARRSCSATSRSCSRSPTRSRRPNGATRAGYRCGTLLRPPRLRRPPWRCCSSRPGGQHRPGYGEGTPSPHHDRDLVRREA
jgi:hypothetical protein